MISISLLVLGLGTMLLSLTNNIWFLIVVYGLVLSTASSGVSLVTVHGLLSKWFFQKRSLVLSLCTAGTSAGGLVLVPLAANLIEATDWRITWLVLGGFILFLALPVVLFIVKDSPEEIGETPDGEGAPVNQDGTRRATTVRKGPLEAEFWQESFRSAPIWQLSGAYFVCGVTTLIISAHYVPFALDRGVTPQVAATAFGLMMGLNAVGVVVIGILANRFSRKNLLGTVYFIRFLAYMMLVFGPGAHRDMGFRRAGRAFVDCHASSDHIADRRHLRAKKHRHPQRDIDVLASDRRLHQRVGGGTHVRPHQQHPVAARCHKLDPSRLRSAVPARWLDPAWRDHRQLFGQRAQVLDPISTAKANSCCGIGRRQRLMPLLSALTHHGEPGDPVLLEWIQHQIDSVLGLGDWAIVVVLGAVIVAITDRHPRGLCAPAWEGATVEYRE